MRRQRGIALIQVLLVTGIIGLLMLQMGLTARAQVERAQALADRAELALAAQSRESALVYSLLTETLSRKPDGKNPYARAWNFTGEPFTVDGITFSIEDESGRMRVPEYEGGDFERLLVALDVPPTRARQITLELMDLQGSSARMRDLGERSGKGVAPARGLYPLQDLGELSLLPGMDEALYRRLRPLLTLYPTPGFNPTTAPPALLKAKMTRSQVTGLEDAREQGSVDGLELAKLTGAEADESTVLWPGPALTVRLEMQLRAARARRATTFIVRPYDTEAFAVWERKGDEPQDES